MITVTDILTAIGNVNTTVQQVRDFLKANPVATPAQLQQISDAVGGAQTTATALQSDLGIITPPAPPTPPAPTAAAPEK